MQALATMMRPQAGPWRRKRGLLSWVEAQARTQSSQRVQRSRSISIVAVPLKKRPSVMNASRSAPIFPAAPVAGGGSGSSAAGSGARSINAGSSRAGSVGNTTRSITAAGTASRCV